MNNKGQALVAFVLLLPIMFLLFAIVFDLGSLGVAKQKYENEIKSTIKYGLNHIEDKDVKEKMQNMLETNIEGNKNIEINDKTIRINIKNKKESIFPNIIKKDYDLDITYKGYKENNQIIIKKD